MTEVVDRVGESEMLESTAGPAPVPSGAARDLVHGTSALGLAVIIERGFGFVANLLAARIGGASVFGAYSLAITTANNVSTYAAGGIGSTAIRFSGKYQRNHSGYATLARVLAIISTVSAVLGGLVLWLGAAPIAHLLGKASLTSLLQWTALSAGGMILLECCRGFLVGQRRIPAILLLSLTVGIGMITLVPLSARFGPVAMIACQGAICVAAVVACLSFYRQLGLAPEAATSHEGLRPMLRTVWSFGLMQLAGLIGLNAAGWWLTSLIAHADTSMTQMGFFAIGSQLRNIASLAPSLLTESSLAVMAHSEDDAGNTPDRVMAACTFATTFASLVVAGAGLLVTPWVLPMLYGKTYAAGAAAVVVALATSVVHMGSAPAAARMNILSIRTSGVINTIWAMVVAVAATVFLLSGGNAVKAALIYLVAHIVSAILLFASLSRRGCLRPGVAAVAVVGTGGTCVLVCAGLLRASFSAYTGLLTTGMTGTLLFTAAWLFLLGRRHHWVPSSTAIWALLESRGLRLRHSNASGAKNA